MTIDYRAPATTPAQMISTEQEKRTAQDGASDTSVMGAPAQCTP